MDKRQRCGALPKSFGGQQSEEGPPGNSPAHPIPSTRPPPHRVVPSQSSLLQKRGRCRELTFAAARLALFVVLTRRISFLYFPRGKVWSSLGLPKWPKQASITRCFILQTDLETSLPEAGQLIRLGDFALSPKRQEYVVDRSLLLTGEGGASWDLLWDDYYGAFDQQKSQGVSALSIPWRWPHNPVFLVVYYERAPIRVYLKETVVATALPSFPDYAGNVTCPANLKVETVDVQKTFEQPLRQPNFRVRLDSSGVVTVCTQLTIERLPRLVDMARMYQGPISAVVYVGFRGDIAEQVELLGKFWDESDVLRQYVDLHLVFDNKKPWYATGKTDTNYGHNPYPINLLRQYSVDQARTEWILYQEADMVMVKNSHQLILNRWDAMMELHKKLNQLAVFVVPIYSYNGDTIDHVPSDKTGITKALSSGRIFRISDIFKSHGKLNYEGWENSTTPTFLPYDASGDPKAISTGQNQEPYFIIRKKDMPPYNVLFMGMPADKESHTVNTNQCGFVFFLHPDLFAMNFGGPSGSGKWTNPERQGNAAWRQDYVRRVHQAYKEEVQKARRQVDGGTLCQI